MSTDIDTPVGTWRFTPEVNDDGIAYVFWEFIPDDGSSLGSAWPTDMARRISRVVALEADAADALPGIQREAAGR